MPTATRQQSHPDDATSQPPGAGPTHAPALNPAVDDATDMALRDASGGVLAVLDPVERVALADLLADTARLKARFASGRRTPMIVTGVTATWAQEVRADPLGWLRRRANKDAQVTVNRTPRRGQVRPGDRMSLPDFLAAVFDRAETARVFGLGAAEFPDATIPAFRPPADLLANLPIRDRYFGIETGMLFIGNDSSVNIHYDREWNDLLHIAIAGRRRLTLFAPDQSIGLHKLPLISDSTLEFGALPADAVGLGQVRGYRCVLEPGEMLVLPARYWHFIEYIEPSAAVSYSYYTNRITWALGTLNGLFYNGFSVVHAFHTTRWFRRWGAWYATTRARLKYGRGRGPLAAVLGTLGLGLVDLSERLVYCLLWYPMLFLFLARYRGGTGIYSATG